MKKADKSYYDRQYFSDRAEGQKCMAFSIWKFLEEQKVRTVLDVGCGSGWLMRYLEKRGFKVKGCDVADEAVRLSGAIKAPATDLPFKSKSFDAVLGISIIEHLTKTEAQKFPEEAVRVLKKGGWFFLVTPNYATPLRFFLGKKWGGYYDPTHINLYTPWVLKDLLKKYPLGNFKLTYNYYPNIPFDLGFPRIFLKMPRVVKNFLNFLFICTPLHYLRHSFWLAAQKK